jgi:hypothetical protein
VPTLSNDRWDVKMTKVKAESKAKVEVTPKAEAAPKATIEPEVVEATSSEVETEVQDFNLQQIESAEMAMDSLIEFNASAYKSGEVVTKALYGHYVANVNDTFSGIKALADTTDAVAFYKVAADNTVTATERMMEQFQVVSELTGQAMQETRDASYKAYSQSFQ